MHEIKRVLKLVAVVAIVLNFAVVVALAEEPPFDKPPGGGAPEEYQSVFVFSEDTEEIGGAYLSEGIDENAILVTDGNVILREAEITRINSSSSGDDAASFYGVGAAVLNTGGHLAIEDSTISTEANGGAGVFSYGEGTAEVRNTAIRTNGRAAGGIHAAGGGTLFAYDLDVETQGESSAAIRSDRGGGTIVVDGGSYVSNGSGSPAVYSTADITVHDALLRANGSEAVCIEGKNSLRLYDCDLFSAMPDQEANDHTWSVILYQSMSGDAEEGTSSFEMTGGSLTSENGGLFYTTNTSSTFYLQDVRITAAEDCEYFLRASGNANARGWGTTGDNGAETNFTAVMQVMEGDVIWDSSSELYFYMIGASELKGAFRKDDTYAGQNTGGSAVLTVDETSTWIVTGDSYLTSLYNEGLIVDEENRNVTVAGTDGTVYLEGSSPYKVTVESYGTETDISQSVIPSSWDGFKQTETVSVPEESPDSTPETVLEPEEESQPEAAGEKTERTFSPLLAEALLAGAISVCVNWFLRKKQTGK